MIAYGLITLVASDGDLTVIAVPCISCADGLITVTANHRHLRVIVIFV